MLMIRLQRVGRKHEPVFRIVLTDSKNAPKSGKFLEVLGYYDARKEDRGEFKLERIQHWMRNGAQLSNTIHNFLIDKKAIEGKKINVLPKKTPIIKEVVASAESSSEPKKEEEKKEEAPVEEISEIKEEIKEEEKETVAEEKVI